MVAGVIRCRVPRGQRGISSAAAALRVIIGICTRAPAGQVMHESARAQDVGKFSPDQVLFRPVERLKGICAQARGQRLQRMRVLQSELIQPAHRSNPARRWK